MDFVDVFVKFWMLRALSINSWGQKTAFFEKKTPKKVKVLDVEGIINKFLGVKSDISKKQALKCGGTCLRRTFMAEKWPLKKKCLKCQFLTRNNSFLSKNDDYLITYAYFLQNKKH